MHSVRPFLFFLPCGQKRLIYLTRMRRGSNNRETPKGVPSSKNNRQLATCRPFRDSCMRTKPNSYHHGSYRQGSKTLFHAYRPCPSVHLPTCLSICPPAYLPVHLSTCLPAYLPVQLPTNLSICLTAYLSVHLPTCLSICLTAYLPVHLSDCLSACLLVCIFISQGRFLKSTLHFMDRDLS